MPPSPTMLGPDTEAALKPVLTAQKKLTEAEENVVTRRRKLHEALREANRKGISQKVLGKSIGLSKQRVSEVITELEQS